MTEYPKDIMGKALNVRNSMCMDCECKFVVWCVCLDNVAQALMEEREKAARIAEREGVYPELNVFAGGPEWYQHGKRIAAAIRSGGE